MREFNGIAAFMAHLAAVEIEVHVQAEHALERSAQLVEKAAKAELGHYQPEVGHTANGSNWPIARWRNMIVWASATHRSWSLVSCTPASSMRRATVKP